MRVLIRENRTSKFLAKKQQWVPVRTQALDFGGSVMAVDVADQMGLKGIEIVLDFGHREVVLPVPDESESSAQAA
jgi:hypothetical protein